MAWAMSKTKNGNSYATTSIYETKIYNLGDSSVTKKLVSFTIMTEYLDGVSNAAQVVVKYNKDEQIGGTSFGTTILTHSTQDAFFKTAVNDSTGVTLPIFKEIQFRLESLNNAVITGFKFKWEVIDNDLT